MNPGRTPEPGALLSGIRACIWQLLLIARRCELAALPGTNQPRSPRERERRANFAQDLNVIEDVADLLLKRYPDTSDRIRAVQVIPDTRDALSELRAEHGHRWRRLSFIGEDREENLENQRKLRSDPGVVELAKRITATYDKYGLSCDNDHVHKTVGDRMVRVVRYHLGKRRSPKEAAAYLIGQIENNMGHPRKMEMLLKDPPFLKEEELTIEHDWHRSDLDGDRDNLLDYAVTCLGYETIETAIDSLELLEEEQAAEQALALHKARSHKG